VTTSADIKDTKDLKDAFGSSQYTDLSKDGRFFDRECALRCFCAHSIEFITSWAGAGSFSSSASGTACGYRGIGVYAEFYSSTRVHEVEVRFGGSSNNDYQDNRALTIRLGDSGGLNDAQFGPSGGTACSQTSAWQSTSGKWNVFDTSMSRTGRRLTAVSQSNNCNCGRRRELHESLSPESNQSFVTTHGRLLPGVSCTQVACGMVDVAEVQAFQYSCPAGTYPLNPSSIANGNCATCDSGYWCPGGLLGDAASTYRLACPPPTVGAGTGKSTQAAACAPCAAGRYYSSGVCLVCSDGSYCPEGSSTQQQCPAGSYCPTPAQKLACSSGYLCPAGSTSQQPCSAGHFCANNVQTSCPAGSYCPALSAAPVTCPAGSYCPAVSSTPTPCLVGRFCPAGSASSSECALGSYCVGGARYDCPIGRYGNQTNAPSSAHCAPCPAGRFGSRTGGTTMTGACSLCPAGSWTSEGASSCYPLVTSSVAADTNEVETGLSAADVLSIEFGADTNSPDISTSAVNAHGRGIYSSIVMWSRLGLGSVPVYCSSPDPAVVAAVAAAAGVATNQVVHRALFGDPTTQIIATWESARRILLELKTVGSFDATGKQLLDPSGFFQVFPAPGMIKSATGASLTNDDMVRNSVAVEGTWGVAGDPALVTAVARNSGSSEGLGVGDSIELLFNQALGAKRLSTILHPADGAVGARGIIDLLPPNSNTPYDNWNGVAYWAQRPAGASAGRAASLGDYPPNPALANLSTIVIVFTQVPMSFATSGPSSVKELMPGFARVRVRLSADMRGSGAFSVLPPANNTVALSGSWGEVPTVPVFKSHSSKSALLQWREPHRPEGSLTAEGWAKLGLEGYVVSWCHVDLTPLAADAEKNAVAISRERFPGGLGNASTSTPLMTGGACMSAYVKRAQSDLAMATDLSLPLLATDRVPLTSSTRLLVGVATVFNGWIGPFMPAVDVSPVASAGSALGEGIGSSKTPKAQCVVVDWSAGLNSGTPAPCSPSAEGVTAQVRRSCRCRLQKQSAVNDGQSNDDPRMMGFPLGSAFSAVLEPMLDGVSSSGDMSTIGGQFFFVHGSGLPIAVEGLGHTDDHQRAFEGQLSNAVTELSNTVSSGSAKGFMMSFPSAAVGGSVTVRSTPTVPYLKLAYGKNTTAGLRLYYSVNAADCTITLDGLTLRCLSVPGVGRDHQPFIEINGQSPSSLSRAALSQDQEVLTSTFSTAYATLSYAAPYIQEYEHEFKLTGFPTVGGDIVTIIGREFGPIGSTFIDVVTYSPSRHNKFEFTARNCSVTVDHTKMRCITPQAAGAKAFWTITIAEQQSLLPDTSSAAPVIQSISLVTPAMAQTASLELRTAIAQVLGLAQPAFNASSNSTTPSGDVLSAALSQLPSAASLLSVPTSGGMLVFLDGLNFGPSMQHVAKVWYERVDGVSRVSFEQDVDVSSSALAPGCAMVTAHKSLVCKVLPGAGGDYAWRLQVLDLTSSASASKLRYSPVEVNGLALNEIPSEGLTSLLRVNLTNLPPIEPSFPVSVSFNGWNVTNVVRDQLYPYSALEIRTQPVIVPPQTVSPNVSTNSFYVPLVVSTAGDVSLWNIPIKRPEIREVKADSPRRIASAVATNPPPMAAGGVGAVLLELYGSSFGGDRSGLRVHIDDQLCVGLTEEELHVHLTPTATNYDPHLEYYCWTLSRYGVVSFADARARPSVNPWLYDFASINSPPVPSTARIVDINGTVLGGGDELSTVGGEWLLVEGTTMSDVSLVELVLLASGAVPSTPSKDRTITFRSPCTIINRLAVQLETGIDPCKWVNSNSLDSAYIETCKSSTQVLCAAPPGLGTGWFIRAQVDSASAPLVGISVSAIAGYSNAELTGVTPISGPSKGGFPIFVKGARFGISVLPLEVTGTGLSLPVVKIGGQNCPLISRNDSLLVCTAPAGIHRDAAVLVSIGGRLATQPSMGREGGTLLFSYDPPTISRAETYSFEAPSTLRGASDDNSLPLRLSTRGGWLRLMGSNFGPSPIITLEDVGTGAVLQCSADAQKQPSVPTAHNETWCRMAAGAGDEYRIKLQTATDGQTTQASFVFGFDEPRIVSVFFDNLQTSGSGARSVSLDGSGRRPTQGLFLIHVIGHSFSADPSVYVGSTPCAVVAGLVNPVAPLSLNRVIATGDTIRQPQYPPVELDSTNLFAPGASTSFIPQVTVTSPDGASRRWVTHELVTCVAPAGDGLKQLRVSSSAQRSSLPFPFAYDRPTLQAADPAFFLPLLSDNTPLSPTLFRGTNFGALATDPASSRRLINMTVSLIKPYAPSAAAVRVRELRSIVSARLHAGLPVSEEALAGQRRELQSGQVVHGVPVVTTSTELCQQLLMPTAHADVQCTPYNRFPVGMYMISTGVGGQSSDERIVFALCPTGYYGAPGEVCKPCPLGAYCAGGFAEPQPTPGFFKQSASAMLACDPKIACRGAIGAGIPQEAFDFRKLLLGSWQPGVARPALDPALTPKLTEEQVAAALAAVGPADLAAENENPKESSIGAWRASVGALQLDIGVAFPTNGSVAMMLKRFQDEAEAVKSAQCISGYEGPRCSRCANRFYRLEGMCEPCPELAWLIIPGFLLALMALLAVAMYLQKKNVQLAGLSVGVDMMQILSVFAALDLSWPIEVRAVWTTVSATTFSLQILAPECSIQVSYSDKFFAVASIPPLLAVGTLGLVVVDVVRKYAPGWIAYLKRNQETSPTAPPSPATTRKCPSIPPALVSRCDCAWLQQRIRGRGKVVTGGNKARKSGLLSVTWQEITPSPLNMIRSPMSDDDADRKTSPVAVASPVSPTTAAASGAASPKKPAPPKAKKPLSYGRALSSTPVAPPANTKLKPASTVAASDDDDGKNLNATMDAAIGLILTLLYYAYLTATRNALQPLDCVKVMAADGSGLQKVVRMEPSVVCDSARDPTFARVMPWSVITLFLYGVGIPLLFSVILYCNRRVIVEDQKLLAKGEGHSSNSNPWFSTRKRYGRLYADFKPEVFWWRIVLTLRKAMVATISIMLTGNPTFAASMTALVLFVSYLLHQRFLPFLAAPSVSDEFLKLADDGAPVASPTASTPVVRDAAWSSKSGKRRGSILSAINDGPKWSLRRSCPPWFVSCLRNTSPIFALCLSGDSTAAKRQNRTRPNIDFEGSTRALDTGDDVPKKKFSIFRSLSSSGMAPSKKGGGVPSKAARRGAVSAFMPSSALAQFASVAAAALEVKAREDAIHAAKIARNSSLAFKFDYNALEGSFLITGVLVLIAGLAFSSNALVSGTPQYYVIVFGISLLIAGALLGFLWILGFELYRSLRFADVLTKARAFQDRAKLSAKRRTDAAARLSKVSEHATNKAANLLLQRVLTRRMSKGASTTSTTD
jgi:hypothetical protein